MNQNIKVSVVVAVYNVKDYLKQCIDSLCNQTLKEIEIICVDDGSTDGSLEILLDYEKRYHNIIVLQNKQEGCGAAHARNLGLDNAKGEYVLVVDSDDYFHNEMTEKVYSKAVANDADVVIFDTWEFDSITNELIYNSVYLKQDLIPKLDVFSSMDISNILFQSGLPVAWNKLVKKGYLEDNNIIFKPAPVADDVFFTYSILLTAQKISVVDEKLLFYRINNNTSQSKKKDQFPLRGIEIGTEIRNLLVEKNLLNIFENSYIIWVIENIYWYWEACISINSFKKLYIALHEGAISKMGISKKNMCILSKTTQKWIDDVHRYNVYEYLYNNYKQGDLLKTGFFRFQFPEDLVSKNDKVILYGAGLVGKVFYAQNTLNGFCDIIAWVDRNHENLPTPVIGLEVLTTLKYDKIVVANENTVIQKQIVSSLVNMGISIDKIIVSV